MSKILYDIFSYPSYSSFRDAFRDARDVTVTKVICRRPKSIVVAQRRRNSRSDGSAFQKTVSAKNESASRVVSESRNWKSLCNNAGSLFEEDVIIVPDVAREYLETLVEEHPPPRSRKIEQETDREPSLRSPWVPTVSLLSVSCATPATNSTLRSTII
ncbi:hypothetical protein K0M31_014101 [Melipona bicolor]|uniref:Uncharacterized protein n=1 Tax=Melipona bicolor TaxID=60889 RepID=A0AA40G7W6_9HYME|nr:hypothetical protein K0M31_014101 [Melipona bicolor]